MNLFSQALGLVFSVGAMFVIALALAGLVAGTLRVITQIDEPAVSLLTKATMLLALVYLWSGGSLGEVLSFAKVVWSNANYYY